VDQTKAFGIGPPDDALTRTYPTTGAAFGHDRGSHPERLRDLLLEVIVGATGGDEAKWRNASSRD